MPVKRLIAIEVAGSRHAERDTPRLFETIFVAGEAGAIRVDLVGIGDHRHVRQKYDIWFFRQKPSFLAASRPPLAQADSRSLTHAKTYVNFTKSETP